MQPPEAALFAAFGLFAGQLVKGTTGFGSALVSLPILAMGLPPATGMLLVSSADVAVGASLTWGARREVFPRLAFAVLLPFLPAQWLGTAALVHLPVDLLRAGLAVLVGLFGASLLWRPVRDGQGTRTSLPDPDGPLLARSGVLGVGAGLLSGALGTPGPPMVWYLRRHFVDAVVRAHMLAILFPCSATLIAMMYSRGALDDHAIALVPWALPAGFLGAWLGSLGAGRFSPPAMGRLVGALLLGSAIGLALH